MKASEKKIACWLLCLFILAVIPLYYISGYAHPSVDDYSYGKFGMQTWQETGSFITVLIDAWKRTAHTYMTWQGTFSSIFLMRLQPAIFGEEYYFLTTVVLLTAFLAASLFFYRMLFGALFYADINNKTGTWIAAGVLTLGAVEFTHVVSDSFYWYNGGITYTFFYCLELLLFSLLIGMYRAKRQTAKCILGLFCILLAFVTCGGNYVTSLITVELLFFGCVYMFILRFFYKKIKKIDTAVFLLVFLSAASGFLTAVLAPGNAIRQAQVGEALPPVLAIFLSFIYGAYSIANCLSLPALVLFAFCIPFFAGMAADSIKKKESVSFHCPVLVTVLSYCLYSSQVTPVIYAQGVKIPYRIMNILYFSCYIMVAINLFYWIGYLMAVAYKSRKEGQQKGKTPVQKIGDFLFCVCPAENKISISRYALICLFLFAAASVGRIHITADMDEKGHAQVEISQMPATVSALYSLATGEAQRYDKEAWLRYQMYTDKNIKDVVVEPFTAEPDSIFHSDITSNPKNWKNKCVKKYFGKASVKRKEN